MTVDDVSLPQRFVQLALELDKHLPGNVDAYFGPPEWKETSVAHGPQPIADLARQAAALAVDIQQDAGLDDQRRDYLARHVTAMQTSLRLLQGEVLPLAEEAALLFDVNPSWVDEREFDAAQQLLDDLLPPGTSLRERLIQHKHTTEISYAQAEPLLSIITTELRRQTQARFPLPADESFKIYPVTNQPWSAYNWYLGGGRSRIEINTDLPLHITNLANLIAHEGYAGHHTELTLKEAQLLRGQGRWEHCLAFINAPSCVIAEGIAVRALDILLADDEQIRWHAAEIFPRAGFTHLDAAREHALHHAIKKLDDVGDNAAFLLHDQRQPPAKVKAYLQHYGLLSEKEAEKTVDFLNDPRSRSYVFTYGYGGKLLDDLCAAKGKASYWFSRLLTEAVTPSQIRQWINA